MTIPSGDPLPIPITNTPALICPPLGQGSSVLVLNNDTEANLFLGRTPGITETNSMLLAPGASSVWDATRPTYAFTDSTAPPIIALVSPGTSQYNLGPSQIVQTLDIVALAAAIAAAIATQGVPLLAKPTLLYQVPAQTQPGTLVGATVGKLIYSGQTQAQADATLDGFIGRPMATIAQKIFYQLGSLPTTVNTDVQAVINSGASCIFSLIPFYDQTNVYNPNALTQDGTTTFAQERVKLANCIQGIQNAGLAPANMQVCLKSEANVGNFFATPAAYVAYVNFYQDAVRNPQNYVSVGTATGIPLIYCPAVANVPWDGYTGGVALGPANYDAIGVDYYANNWVDGYRLDGTGSKDVGSYIALADGHTPSPVPISVIEINDCTKQSTATTTAQWYTPNGGASGSYIEYLISLFGNRITTGKKVGWMLGWFGNNITQTSPPIPADGITSATDYKVPGFQALFDGLSNLGVTGSIPAGATAVVQPINPSPNADFAVANALGYEITLGLTAGVGSTIPFASVILNWFATDNANNNPVATERWVVPLGSNGTIGTTIIGAGRQKGAFLKVRIFNLDTVALNYTVQLNSSGRSFDRDNWWWDVTASVSVPTFTTTTSNLAAGATGVYANVVGLLNSVTIPANSTKVFLCGLFAGNTYFRFNATGAGQVNVTLTPVPSGYWASPALINETPTGEFITFVNLPRSPCIATITNNDGAASHNVGMELIALN